MSRAGGGDRWGQVAGQQRGRGGGLAPPGDSPGLSALRADWLVRSPDLPPASPSGNSPLPLPGPGRRDDSA